MWRIQKKEKFDIWENDLCSLKVQYEESNVEFMLIIKGIMLLFRWEYVDLKMKFRKER